MAQKRSSSLQIIKKKDFKKKCHIQLTLSKAAVKAVDGVQKLHRWKGVKKKEIK